jgi:hypothetical protein
MGVWCDPVRNQFGENGCDYDLRTGWPGNKRVSLDCSGDENAIATAIQRWLNSCLDFGLPMGVAVSCSAMVVGPETNDVIPACPVGDCRSTPATLMRSAHPALNYKIER